LHDSMSEIGHQYEILLCVRTLLTQVVVLSEHAQMMVG
jgi:hypothetical protein